MHRPFAQPHRKRLSRRYNFPATKGFVILGLESRQHLVGWHCPIHWNRMTTMSRANQPQGSSAPSTAHYKQSMTVNDLTASQTIAFVIQGLPFSILIETLQNFEFFGRGKFDGRKKWGHGQG